MRPRMLVQLRLPHGMADDGPELLGGSPSRVAEVDLVMVTDVGEVKHVALLDSVCIHRGRRRRFGVIGADVHALHADALVERELLHG